MALFVAGSAFGDPAVLNSAKLAIIIGSLASGVLGSLILALTSRERVGSTSMKVVAAT
jgi:Na+/H+ antiporter NhaA